MASGAADTFYRYGAPPMQYAAINASAGGNNTVVSAVTGKRIQVQSYVIVTANSVTVTWESGGGAVIAGPYAIAANGGISTPYAESGHFRTVAGEALVLDLGGAVQVGGHLTYVLV